MKTIITFIFISLSAAMLAQTNSCAIIFSTDAGALVHQDESSHKCGELLIQSLPPVSPTPTDIKINFDRGTYTFKRDPKFNIPANQCVYIEDLFTGKFFDLKSSESYSFVISHITKETRFVLHTDKPVTKSSISPVCSYKENGMAILKTNLPGTWDYTWVDAIGNTLTTHANRGKADTLQNLTPGVYHVVAKSTSESCSYLSDSVVIKSARPIVVKSFINNNTMTGEKQGEVRVEKISGGSAPYKYKWSTKDTLPGIKNLPAAVYILALTDAKGCQDTTFHVVHNTVQKPINNSPADSLQKATALVSSSNNPSLTSNAEKTNSEKSADIESSPIALAARTTLPKKNRSVQLTEVMGCNGKYVFTAQETDQSIRNNNPKQN